MARVVASGLAVVIGISAFTLLILPFWIAGLVLIAGFVAVAVIATTMRASTGLETELVDEVSLEDGDVRVADTQAKRERDAEAVIDSSH